MTPIMEAEIHRPPPTTTTNTQEAVAGPALRHLEGDTTLKVRLLEWGPTEDPSLVTAQVILKIPMATIPIIETAGLLPHREVECRRVVDEIMEANTPEARATAAVQAAVADMVVLRGVDQATVVPSTVGNTVDSTTVRVVSAAAPDEGTHRHHTIVTNTKAEDHSLHPGTILRPPLRGAADSPIPEAAAVGTIIHPIGTVIQMQEALLLRTTGVVRPPPIKGRPLGVARLQAIPTTTGIIRSNNR